MPFTRKLISVAAATFVAAAGLTVPATMAYAVSAGAPSLTVTDIGGNPASSVATGTALPVTTTAPITSAGQTGQSVETTWDSGKASVTPSSIVTPEGWATEYTTDGSTWSPTQPGNAATISGVRASGNVSSDGITNGLQVSTATGTGTVVTGAAHFQGSSGGDGWDAFDAGVYILNIWHHNGGSYNLDCHGKLTGDSCGSVYSVSGYQTSGASTGNVVGNKVYSYVIQNSSSTMGVLCTDVSALPFTSCGYTSLLAGPNAYAYLGSQTLVGTKLYAPTTYGGGKLMCYDTSTNAACAGAPYSASGMTSIGTAPAYSMDANGDIWVTANKVWCFSDTTGAACAGSWPVGTLATNSQSVTPLRDSSGTMTGVCTIITSESCWDLSGASVGYPAGLASQIATYPVGGLGGYSQFTFNATRAYWFTGSWGNVTPVACYDWLSSAACAGFQSTTGIAATRYALRFDSHNPNCLWSNGDNGQLASIDANTGVAGCTDPNPTVKIPYTNVVPRLSCAEVGRVREWKTLTLTAPSGIDVTTLKVTVDDHSDNPITGFVDLNPDASGVVDLSSLSVASSGTQPTFLVTVPGATVTVAAQLTAAVQYASDPPQVCYQLTTKANCPSLAPGLSAGPAVAVDALVVSGQAVATVGSVDTASPVSASVTQADATGCVGTLSGTAQRTYPGGTAALANAPVELVAPDSSVVGTAATASDGTYAFANVNPASYQVRIAGQLEAATVAAAGSAIANFALPVADPVASNVSSHTVQNTATTFSTSVTTDPTTSVNPASVRFLDSSSSAYVASLSVAGEGVWSATPAGNLVFTPETGFTGTTAAVTYQVADLYGTTTSAQATVTVLAVLPTAKSVHASGVQGDWLALSPDASSATVALDPASLRLLDPATGARVDSLAVPNVGTYTVDHAAGTLRFTPLPTFSGADTEIYQVLDSLGRTATSTLTVTLSPLAAVGGTSTGRAGGTGTGSLAGVPDGSVVSVPGSVAHTRSVTVHGSTLNVVPAKNFAGIITVPVTVTHGSASVTTMMTFTFLPAAVKKGSHTLDRHGNSVVSWTRSLSAASYLVRVNGKIACSTTKSSCVVSGLLGPKATVKVIALAAGVLRSTELRVPYRFTGCTSVGAAHFDTASYQLLPDASSQVRHLAIAVKTQGFTHVCLTGFTDSRASVAYNQALSFNRVHTVGRYLARWMKHQTMQRVGLRMAYQGEFYPASTNISDAGRAANRRVTLALG